MQSRIVTFVVGTQKKEYSVHAAALSKLSRPLKVLLDGPFKEANNSRVDWLDVDEKTFVRFTQWAYTRTYVTEEPDIILDQSSVGLPTTRSGASKGKKTKPVEITAAEQPLYSLVSIAKSHGFQTDQCTNKTCSYRGSRGHSIDASIVCLVCQESYETKACNSCYSAFKSCPRCEFPETTNPGKRGQCSNTSCSQFERGDCPTNRQSLNCVICRRLFQTKTCTQCNSAFSDCPYCIKSRAKGKRKRLVDTFLDRATCTDDNANRPSKPASVFTPRKNTEGCEDYTGVFLCHAKLYTLGDMWDVPQLCQLSLHRLHETLKEFTLYPSRLDDIATLAKYVFENTCPKDEIRDMITLYYACIVEDASKHDGLRSLIDEVPDFAFGLISRMSERLA